jgi:hypothetical protein
VDQEANVDVDEEGEVGGAVKSGGAEEELRLASDLPD